MTFRTGFWLAAAVWLCLTAADDQATDHPDARQALGRLQSYVGQWRGVGQPRRGSSRGAWTEESEWIWDFKAKEATIAFESPQAKYFQRGAIHATDKLGHYRLVVQHDDTTIEYAGILDDEGQLTLVSSDAGETLPARISIRTVAGGDRLIVLYESRAANDRFQRMAEVGFTRKGSNFGKGTAYVECVVTGGQGTIPVTHEGKTYYVCCTGCRDYFNEDPAAVLEEYRAKKAKDKARKTDKS